MFAQPAPPLPKGLTVLIAEDSPTQAEHLRTLLERNGFAVIAARNGKEALAIAREQHPSVIVSDVMMPEMDGYELCRALKAEAGLRHIPALLVTELSSPQDVFKGLDAGADNFVVKPYEESHLVSRIGYLLANKRLRSTEKPDGGIEIELSGKRHLITADRQQILDLLISTYAQAVVLYDRLESRQKELARSYDTLDALYGLAGGLNRCRTEAEVATFAVNRAMHIPGVRATWLNMRAGENFQIVGRDEELIAADGINTACAGCTCERMLAAGDLTTTVNIPRCERLAHLGDAQNPGAHVSIPLTVDGAATGLLNLVGSEPPGIFSEEERRTLTTVGNQISDALERARLHEALERKVEERTAALKAEVVERRQAELVARTAGDRLLDAIESISDGFALYDAVERLLICNSRYREMHAVIAHLLVPGARFEELVRAGLDCGSGNLVLPDEQTVGARLAQHRRADAKPLILRRDDCWLMLSERRTRDSGVVVVETDITELKKVDKAKDEFLATVSHELRTPLTSIRAALSLLDANRNATLPENLHKLLDLAHRNCARLMRIVDDLLEVARIGAGNFKLEMRLTDLQPILEQAIEGKCTGLMPSNVKLDVREDAKGVRLVADPVRIQQVIDNLISNAIKFSDPDAEINLVVNRHDDVVRVSVIDHGVGIPENFHGRVFGTFAQADSSSTRNSGGTGLGLSIAKTIVEAHRGKIGFTSVEGRGTTFYFDLPLRGAA